MSSLDRVPTVAGPRRALRCLALLAAAAFAAVAAAALTGSVDLGPRALWDTLLGRADAPSIAGALLRLRVDRALCAFAVGAALSLSGALMQALLRNPLADPYVLGVSGGAAVGALAAMLASAAAWLVDCTAFAGAATVSFLLLALDRRTWLDPAAHVLLLTGVVLAAGCGALVALMLALAPDAQLRGMVFWLIGDLSGAVLRPAPWLALAAVLGFALRRARAINLLSLDAESAAALGVPVVRLRRILFGGAALLTATAVAVAGSIGFVGLIVPHACRLALGPDHRLLLPAATIAGGGFLVIADTFARTIAAPLQLPVGAITALIGVPVFLLQLRRPARSRDA